MNNYFMRIAFLVLVAAICASATLSKNDKKKPNAKDTKPTKIAPAIENVVQRGLVQQMSVKATDIIKEHQSFCDLEREVKHFQGDSLAYITPWNNHGYDIAKIFARKFTYISPVWLQIQHRPTGSYAVQGKHDIDNNWVKEVNKGRNVFIVPRVLFDGWKGNDFHTLFSSEDEQQDCIRQLLDVVEEYDFDGIVLEIWSQLGGHRHNDLIHFIGHVAEAFHDIDKKLVLVLPPPLLRGNVESGFLSRSEFESVASVVDAVSLMTYDYSDANQPGPNSPLDWVRACVEALVPDASSPNRRKILLGLNFYGNNYSPAGGGSLVGPQYIKLLSTYKPKIQWDVASSEHFLKYKTRNEEHLVFYPTLYSIDVRLKMAREMGVGISIWEIGQGLDYFYDLL